MAAHEVLHAGTSGRLPDRVQLLSVELDEHGSARSRELLETVEQADRQALFPDVSGVADQEGVVPTCARRSRGRRRLIPIVDDLHRPMDLV